MKNKIVKQLKKRGTFFNYGYLRYHLWLKQRITVFDCNQGLPGAKPAMQAFSSGARMFFVSPS